LEIFARDAIAGELFPSLSVRQSGRAAFTNKIEATPAALTLSFEF
jgi:hypothetical protein